MTERPALVCALHASRSFEVVICIMKDTRKCILSVDVSEGARGV